MLSAAALPAFSCRITRTFARPIASTSSAVPSVDPSSTTMMSTGCVDAATDRTVDSMDTASLNAGTTTVTGLDGGRRNGDAPRSTARRARRIRRPCRTATTITSSVRRTTSPPTSSRLHSSALTMFWAMATATNMILPSVRSTGPAAKLAGGRPAPLLTVVNVKPSRCISGMSRSNAATVWLRSPPASCSSTTPPWPSSGTALCTIASTPGRSQSRLSTSTSAVT